MLRAPIGMVSCIAMLVAQVPPGFAQNAASSPAQQAAVSPAPDASVSPSIVQAFSAYPKGGPGLSKLLEDLIVGNPQLAPQLVRYVQTSPGLTREQKQAAFSGLATALNRMKVQAADLPVPVYKAPPAPPPVAEEIPWLAILAGAAIVGGGLCLALCDDDDRPIPVSP
jgi:hypothetical protein